MPSEIPSSTQRDSWRRPMIEDLGLIRAFVAVVETGSFSEAGRRLRVVPSTISKHIAALEERLSSQLIIRSTKRASVSELGRRFYDNCLAILREVDAAEIEVGEYRSEPQGLLRITAPWVFGTRYLHPVFQRFQKAHPKVDLDVSLSTTSEDLIAGGVDVAIRISAQLDPGLVALRLAPNYRLYCASPAYLEQRGTPEVAEDLLTHNCLIVRGLSQSARWPIRRPDGATDTIVVSGTFVTNSGELVRQALLAGMGIGHVARFMVDDHLRSGELVELFPESRVVSSHIYAVYPERRNMPLKTRAFLDHLRAEFRTPPSWAL